MTELEKVVAKEYEQLEREFFMVGSRLAMTIPCEFLKDFKELLNIHTEMLEHLEKEIENSKKIKQEK